MKQGSCTVDYTYTGNESQAWADLYRKVGNLPCRFQISSHEVQIFSYMTQISSYETHFCLCYLSSAMTFSVEPNIMM